MCSRCASGRLLRVAHQGRAGVEITELIGQPGGSKEQLTAPKVFGRELGRTFEGHYGHSRRAAPRGPVGHRLELHAHPIVRVRQCGGQVPETAVGIAAVNPG